MENMIRVFTQNNFKITKETTKTVEFENVESKEVIYLLPNIEITIVLNPKTVEGNTDLEERSFGLYHNTSLNAFPKRKHTGKDEIHYGYSFKFQSEEELYTFLSSLNATFSTM